MVSTSNASPSPTSLWNDASCAPWEAARSRYRDLLMEGGGDRLLELDDWFHDDLPRALTDRNADSVTLAELVRIVEWKMHRGVYRGRNLALVRSNSESDVELASRDAFAAVPHPTTPLVRLARLKGVGPATASAVLAAVRPDVYPFFEDVVADQIPDFGAVDFTLKVYQRYAERLLERAALLSVGCPAGGWTPHAVSCALWAAAGGKGS